MRILSHPNNILTQSRCGQKPDRTPPQQSDMQLLIGTPPCCYCGEVKESLFNHPYHLSVFPNSRGGGGEGRRSRCRQFTSRPDEEPGRTRQRHSCLFYNLGQANSSPSSCLQRRAVSLPARLPLQTDVWKRGQSWMGR